MKRENFREMKSGELIGYIVAAHHAYLQKALSEIGELTAKIMRAHGPNHPELFRVHKLFSSLRAELEQHLIKEEELLFPLINKYESGPSGKLAGEINRVMKETEEEHEGAGDILKELRKITAEYTVQEDGCKTFEMAYSRFLELEGDLFRHIHLENNILFKRYEL